jgi:hypothetical protein
MPVKTKQNLDIWMKWILKVYYDKLDALSLNYNFYTW